MESKLGVLGVPLVESDCVLSGFAHREAVAAENGQAVAPRHVTAEDVRSRDIAWKSHRLGAIRDRLHLHTEHRHIEVMGRVFHATPARCTQASFPLLQESQGGVGPHDVLHFGSYNYSGLNGHPRIVAAAAAALQRYGTTISGVRLLNGTCELHLELEHRLARFLGFEDCVTYSSGYLANVSVLGMLCTEQDIVLSDTLNHRSIVDGLRL